MKFIKQSTLISSLIWLILFFALNFYFQKNSLPIIAQSTLDIDASMITDSPIHTENKDQFSSIKKSSQKNQPKPLSESHQHQNKEPKLINHPLPEIPEELRYEAYQTYAIARFHINQDGSSTPELIQPTNNPKLNQLLLNSLKQWRFEPSNQKSFQDIRVDFKVE
jgi:protein TonB